MGFTFLTPIDALFALAAAVPLAAMWLAQSRMEHIRRLFSLTTPRRRELAGVVASLALLPVLMGVAAAQPVVVRHHLLGQRQDTQAFFVFDTSQSMLARTGPHGPTRLARAKHEAEEVARTLGDIPVGLAAIFLGLGQGMLQQQRVGVDGLNRVDADPVRQEPVTPGH